MRYIIQELGGIATWFGEAAIWCWDHTLPLDWLGECFYEIHWYTLNLIRWFWDFDEWLFWAVLEIEEILNWSSIRSLIRNWLPDLEDLHDWWYNWTTWVGQQIESWWNTTVTTVQGWITAATEGFAELRAAWDDFWQITWPSWTANFNTLKAAWDDFWVNIFPTLVSFTWLGTWWDTRVLEVQRLIEDTIKVWFPFYESLARLWGDIELFFTDPLEWLYVKMDEWFERFW